MPPVTIMQPRPKACPSIHSRRRTIHMLPRRAATSSSVRGKVCVKPAGNRWFRLVLEFLQQARLVLIGRRPNRELRGRNKCAGSSARCWSPATDNTAVGCPTGLLILLGVSRLLLRLAAALRLGTVSRLLIGRSPEKHLEEVVLAILANRRPSGAPLRSAQWCPEGHADGSVRRRA